MYMYMYMYMCRYLMVTVVCVNFHIHVHVLYMYMYMYLFAVFFIPVTSTSRYVVYMCTIHSALKKYSQAYTHVCTYMFIN